MEQKKRILICPLDWGLGHATRCVPIIDELLQKKHDVLIASSGHALELLKLEYPSLQFFEIASYNPKYFSSIPFGLSFALQIPKFLWVIRKEHLEVDRIIQEQKIDAIISDNRYGCWSAKIPSILITHQLTIQTKILPLWTNYLHHRKIKNFSICWVPDVAGEQSLAGNLSANGHLKVIYIGHLSRFREVQPRSIQYEVMAIISGPEPQRSVFERLIRNELKKSGKKTLMVKGLVVPSANHISCGPNEVNHLGAKEMNQAILESAIVICRPGYSTLMDLAKLGKRAVFIPTPGQTEQEYLGKKMMQNKIALSMDQHNFDLDIALKKAKEYPGFKPSHSDDLLKTAVNSLFP